MLPVASGFEESTSSVCIGMYPYICNFFNKVLLLKKNIGNFAHESVR